MSDKVRMVERKVGWKCSAHFMGWIPCPSKKELERFLPGEVMAELPDGSVACAIVACRIEQIDPETRAMRVGVRIATNMWSDGLKFWTEQVLLLEIERAFAAVGKADLPGVQGSEVEIAAFLPTGVEVTAEVFERNHGVVVTMGFDYFAEIHRIEAQEVARAERLRRQSSERPQVQSGSWFARFWRRIVPSWKAEQGVESVTSLAPRPPREDPWVTHRDRLTDTFLAVCQRAVGSLLRRTTVYDDTVADHLAQQGVAVGDSPTMQAFRKERVAVTRRIREADRFPMSTLLDDRSDEDPMNAPTPRRLLGHYEAVFPKKPS